jgi:hypothetical protein
MARLTQATVAPADRPKRGYPKGVPVIVGKMTLPELCKTFSGTAQVVKTAHNEVTACYPSGRVVVRLRETDILTFEPDGTVIFCTGGWNTVTTRRHMIAAFKRQTGCTLIVNQRRSIRGISISFAGISESKGRFEKRAGGFFKARGVSRPDGSFVSDLGYVTEAK